MNETVGDLMSQYDRLRDGARRFAAWDPLDEFILELVKRIAIAPNKLEIYKRSDFALKRNRLFANSKSIPSTARVLRSLTKLKKSPMTTPADKFHAVVQWIHDDIVTTRQAPGLIVGLSGTDSIVAYLAAYRALDRANMAHRLMGVHFTPSEDFLADYPEADKHTWFNKEIIPWLRKQTHMSQIVVNDSIDWRFDGLRWGALADISVMDTAERKMRASDNKYWILGTRNRTEDRLFNYSVASTIASVQPLIKLYKSEILDICEWLEVPKLVIQKSCEEDCICGREELRAHFGRELDIILNAHATSLANADYLSLNPVVKRKLQEYISERISKASFKTRIPYVPD
jgi:NH3-dependent NAD+ synthetase